MNSFLGNFERTGVVVQFVLLASMVVGVSGCASYGAGNFSVTLGTESAPALIVPPGVSTSQNLSMVLPIPWMAKCDDGFAMSFAAREGAPEVVHLRPANRLTSTAQTRIQVASPARIDPRKLDESIGNGLANSGTCFASVSQEIQSAFGSNFLELLSTLIPRTFTEDLWHNYLFYPDSNEKLVALRPGMRLRLVFSHFYSAQNLRELREGWASAGTSSVVYDVVSREGCTTLSTWRPTIYGSDNAEFNLTDLSQVLEMNTSPEPDFVVKTFRLINGSWDFVNPACTSKNGVLLLRYPSLVVSQKDIASTKKINALGLPMIFAADNYADAVILSRYADLMDADSPEGTDARDALRKRCLDGRCFLISTRALPIPEIKIVINGTPIWVELGTRIRDVVQADGGTLGAVAYERSGSSSRQSITSPQPTSVEIRRLAPLSRYASFDYRSFKEIGDLILAPNDEVSWK